MEPLNKIQDYAKNLQIKHTTQMYCSYAKQSIYPVFSAQIKKDPDIFICYTQIQQTSGNLIIQHINPHNKTVIKAISKDVKNSRNLNINSIIQELLEELLSDAA